VKSNNYQLVWHFFKIKIPIAYLHFTSIITTTPFSYA
jgi:hypothetical protein